MSHKLSVLLYPYKTCTTGVRAPSRASEEGRQSHYKSAFGFLFGNTGLAFWLKSKYGLALRS